MEKKNLEKIIYGILSLVSIVKLFGDGTFRILSNDVTEQELMLPPVAYSK